MRSARAGVSTCHRYISVLLIQACGTIDVPGWRGETTTYLEPHIVRDVTCDQTSYKVEVGIAGGWICDLNLLEAAFYDLLKEVSFLIDGHGICQGLVAVAEICREPDRRRFCDL